MQPYFFPYLGYFSLINYSDRWIVFDTVQYIRHGWINRNRVLHPTKGWQYIVVPIKGHHRDAEIKDIEIANEQEWKRRIIGQLRHYRKQAPYFHETMTLVEDCLQYEGNSISRLNVFILDKVCEYLGIPFDYAILSEMNLELPPILKPGDWALRISEALGADEYVNPPGGVELFDKRRFDKSNITLTILGLPAIEYTCKRCDYIINLSVIDVLMWVKPEIIKSYLDERNTE